MRRFLRILLALALVATGVGAPVSAANQHLAAAAAPQVGRVAPEAASTAKPTIAQLVGQKLVVRMDGVTPSADLLGRIRRGEVGGVILFGTNITTASALIVLTRQLHAAAAAGGQPHVLIGVDQEGGSIKRIPWAPPTLSPLEMGRLGLTSVARSQGARTGVALRRLGIDVDFAPVADVPATTSSFLYRAGRTFSFSASRAAALSDAFATGLESAGVVPSMKHFPGIGFATRSTDGKVVTITAPKAGLAAGLLPYRMAISHHLALIMLSNAIYPAYDPVHAAGWSAAIVGTLLRTQLGFRGTTITDSLDGIAHARAVTTRSLAVQAARAGTDLILTTGSEASTRQVYAALVREATEGLIPLVALRTSYTRIIALKAGL